MTNHSILIANNNFHSVYQSEHKSNSCCSPHQRNRKYYPDSPRVYSRMDGHWRPWMVEQKQYWPRPIRKRAAQAGDAWLGVGVAVKSYGSVYCGSQ